MPCPDHLLSGITPSTRWPLLIAVLLHAVFLGALLMMRAGDPRPQTQPIALMFEPQATPHELPAAIAEPPAAPAAAVPDVPQPEPTAPPALAEAAPPVPVPAPVPASLPQAPQAEQRKPARTPAQKRPKAEAATTPRQAAPSLPAETPASPAPPAPALDLTGPWRGALASWLRENRIYPDAARQNGIEGRVIVRFTLDRNGNVLAVSLAQSSGAPILDDAAQKMLLHARLPPPPAGGPETISLTLPIRYSLGP